MTDRTPTEIYFDTKKKPFDIKIDNNKKEPKLSKNIDILINKTIADINHLLNQNY